MKAKDPEELGSWSQAVTASDGAWLTRGSSFSQNFTYQIRSSMNGALLFYCHLCQRGEDNICPEPLFEGTSKFTSIREGMKVAVTWQDVDSTSAKAIRQYIPEAESMLCGAHSAKAHFKHMRNLISKKTFTEEDIKVHGKEYPQMHLVSCPCKPRHKHGCGSTTDTFAFSARAKYITALNDAGTDPQKFVSCLKMLAHHTRNEHEWGGWSV